MLSVRRDSAPIYTLALFFLLLGGCGEPVREDRSINWSSEGQSVGFQHGQEGVFIADKSGGAPTKIFQPGKEVIATSTPLWCPVGKQAIFTTARDAASRPSVSFSFGGIEQDPAGNIYTQQAVHYTCWLHEESTGRKSEPIPLFEADCNHVGYVAANLAVRWHPSGRQIFFIKQVGKQHGVFVYDLASKHSDQVFSHTGDAIIFDWTPDGQHLVCLLGSAPAIPSADGVWIGKPGQPDWWHVADSGGLAQGEFPSLLERLRASRPAWTSDGARFAFTSYTPGTAPTEPGTNYIRLGTTTSRQVELLAQDQESYHDLHWAPDGERLGFVRGRSNPSLILLRGKGEPSRPVNRRPVRSFAGWNSSGERLAYIVPDEIPFADSEMWAFLLVPDRAARDVVVVANGMGNEPGREIFSGMRVTFPQWSPREDKLSLWFTFSPTYRSLVSLLLNWGLRPGDPAALFDAKTGKIGWLAVNSHELAQIGHYYLLKRDYAEAWRWYEKAGREAPPAKPQVTADFFAWLRSIANSRDSSFFQYYCLSKLGREKEAQVKLSQFRRTFLPEFRREHSQEGQPSGDLGLGRWVEEVLEPNGFFTPFLRDLDSAEVFLSLDAAEDGEAYFRKAMTTADNESTRLASNIVLAQLLLVERKYGAYADLATHQIGTLWKPVPQKGGTNLEPSLVLDLVSVLALLPMCSADFLAKIPDVQVRAHTQVWQTLRSRAQSDVHRHAIDLVLHAAYERLGMEKERKETLERLKKNPAMRELLPDEDMRKDIKTLREQIRTLFERF
jgi:hypothetical protein